MPTKHVVLQEEKGIISSLLEFLFGNLETAKPSGPIIDATPLHLKRANGEQSLTGPSAWDIKRAQSIAQMKRPRPTESAINLAKELQHKNAKDVIEHERSVGLWGNDLQKAHNALNNLQVKAKREIDGLLADTIGNPSVIDRFKTRSEMWLLLRDTMNGIEKKRFTPKEKEVFKKKADSILKEIRDKLPLSRAQLNHVKAELDKEYSSRLAEIDARANKEGVSTAHGTLWELKSLAEKHYQNRVDSWKAEYKTTQTFAAFIRRSLLPHQPKIPQSPSGSDQFIPSVETLENVRVERPVKIGHRMEKVIEETAGRYNIIASTADAFDGKQLSKEALDVVLNQQHIAPSQQRAVQQQKDREALKSKSPIRSALDVTLTGNVSSIDLVTRRATASAADISRIGKQQVMARA